MLCRGHTVIAGLPESLAEENAHRRRIPGNLHGGLAPAGRHLAGLLTLPKCFS